MPKIAQRKEEIHQPYWATVIRGTPGAFQPIAAMQATTTLFVSTATGNLAITNMDGSSAFSSDSIYRILAMRVFLYFRGCAGTASYGGAISDHMMYHRAMSQLYWELKVASKVEFQAMTSYLPAGGGLYGDVGSDTTVFFVNGMPSQESICKLARSISLPARQGFQVVCNSIALGAANLVTDINALTAGEIHISYALDGLILRDVL